jgi:hypothetical protein
MREQNGRETEAWLNFGWIGGERRAGSMRRHAITLCPRPGSRRMRRKMICGSVPIFLAKAVSAR